VGEDLRDWIEEVREIKQGPYIIVDASGRPYIDPPGLQYRRRATAFGRLFRNGCDRAGIQGKTFHDLRRSGLTEYGNSGATEAELSKIGGHAIGSKVIDVYVKPDKGAAISAANRRWAKKAKTRPQK
jgi:integrase